MQKQVIVSGGLYIANNVGVDTANFEVYTTTGDYIKSFSVQTIGDPAYPEPDYSGVAHLNDADILAIEAILPAYPTTEWWQCL